MQKSIFSFSESRDFHFSFCRLPIETHTAMEDCDQTLRSFTSLDTIYNIRQLEKIETKEESASQVELLLDISERLSTSQEEVIRCIYFRNLENMVKINKEFYSRKHTSVFPIPVFFVGDEMISTRMKISFMKILKNRYL